MKIIKEFLKGLFQDNTSNKQEDINAEDKEMGKISLNCDVTYRFKLPNETIDYDEYYLLVDYEANVKTESKNIYKLNGDVFVYPKTHVSRNHSIVYLSRYDLYERVIDIIQGGDDSDIVDDIKEDIYMKLHKELEKNKSQELRDFIEKNNLFNIELSIEVEKSYLPMN